MIRSRVLTLSFDEDLERFDDTAMQVFLADKELVALKDHFFVYDGRPYMSVVLTYRSSVRSAASNNATQADTKRAQRETWRELLEPGDLPVFNTLREWRGERAKAEGVPRYVICTNRQLAEVVRRRPHTAKELAEIDGFGRAKVRKYGPEMLAYLQVSSEQPKPVADDE